MLNRHPNNGVVLGDRILNLDVDLCRRSWRCRRARVPCFFEAMCAQGELLGEVNQARTARFWTHETEASSQDKLGEGRCWFPTPWTDKDRSWHDACGRGVRAFFVHAWVHVFLFFYLFFCVRMRHSPCDSSWEVGP